MTNQILKTSEIELFLFHVKQLFHVELSESQTKLIFKFIEKVFETQKTANITGYKSPSAFLWEAVLDSFFGLKVLKNVPRGTWLDLGSGSGLPGIPLSILSQDSNFIMVESRLKRWKHLESVIQDLKLQNCAVFGDRFEKLNLTKARELSRCSDLNEVHVLSKATGKVKEVAKFLELSGLPIKTLVLYKGENWKKEDGVELVKSFRKLKVDSQINIPYKYQVDTEIPVQFNGVLVQTSFI